MTSRDRKLGTGIEGKQCNILSNIFNIKGYKNFIPYNKNIKESCSFQILRSLTNVFKVITNLYQSSRTQTEVINDL